MKFGLETERESDLKIKLPLLFLKSILYIREFKNQVELKAVAKVTLLNCWNVEI